MNRFTGLVLSMVMGSCGIGIAGQPAVAPAASQQAESSTGQPQGKQGNTAPAASITPEERTAFQAIQNELDPARQLQLVDDFAKKYPHSPLLTDVYFFGAIASQQKGNIQGVIDYGEKSLQLNGNNLRTLLVLSSVLPQPQASKTDADKAKNLAAAEADANKALQLIAQLPKPPNQTDEQFQKIKQSLNGGAHAALGMVHLVRATEGLSGPDTQELAKSEEEYKAAVSVPNPEPEAYYRLGEAYRMDGKIDEAIDAFTKASQLGQGGPIQTYADQQIKTLKQQKEKTQAKPPDKP